MRPESGGLSHEKRKFFGGLPGTGVWTAVGLSRLEFFLILGISVTLFSVIDGPFWSVGSSHLRRITLSYGAIPVMILALQGYRRSLDVRALFGASVVIGLIKLVVTALLVLSLSL